MDASESQPHMDQLENQYYESDLSEFDLHSDEIVLGIDEAGRGPVLGPMVYGAFFLSKKNEHLLKEMQVADSKTVKEEDRESNFSGFKNDQKTFGWKVKSLSSQYLSNCMLSLSKYNLNSISHDTAIELIERTVKSGVAVHSVFVDTVGPPEKYQEKLQHHFPDLKITVSKKADALFPCVSAASICAKVIRDDILKKWSFVHPPEVLDYGCGYPGDSKTVNFLKKSVDRLFGFPTLVRFSWSTAETMLAKDALKIVWEDDEQFEEKVPRKRSFGPESSMTNFFKPKSWPSYLSIHSLVQSKSFVL